MFDARLHLDRSSLCDIMGRGTDLGVYIEGSYGDPAQIFDGETTLSVE